MAIASRWDRMTEEQREKSRARVRAFKARNRERIRAEGRAYAKSRYQNDSEHAERQREKSRRARAENPQKASESRKRSYAKHADKRRAETRAYYEANKAKCKEWAKQGWEKRRAQKASVESEKINRQAVYDRDGGRCHLCGKQCRRDKFHLDHLVPISRGGSHTYANVAVAHPFCNLSRGPGRIPAQLLLIGEPNG